MAIPRRGTVAASAAALGELVEVAEIALAPCHIGWIRVPRQVGARLSGPPGGNHRAAPRGERARRAYAAALTNLAQVARPRDSVGARGLFQDALSCLAGRGDAVAESRALGYLAESPSPPVTSRVPIPHAESGPSAAPRASSRRWATPPWGRRTWPRLEVSTRPLDTATVTDLL